jgi:hypothetical protein
MGTSSDAAASDDEFAKRMAQMLGDAITLEIYCATLPWVAAASQKSEDFEIARRRDLAMLTSIETADYERLEARGLNHDQIIRFLDLARPLRRELPA